MTDTLRYEFGKNWAKFVEENFDEERVKIAQTHLLRFLKLSDLQGKSFLDIGCGSGIHSLGAYRAGARSVVSFDFDPESANTTRKLWEFAGSPGNWKVMQGSVLDLAFLDALARADIVYSWGVLHHTGKMWQAVENAASTLKEDGVFYIALYTSDVYIDPPPEYWLKVKRDYNQAGKLYRKWMEWACAWRFTIAPELRAGRNPLKTILGYQKSRGMSYWTDIKDWLGGWPMEFAGIAETKAFCADKLGLELINISTGEGNTEYLFRKKGVRNYWDDFMATQKIEPLPGPFTRERGYAWVAPLKQSADTADTNEQPKRSHLMLYEDGVLLGFRHALHVHIRDYGAGRYSHWNDTLIFSTTDNSDPNTNGRQYSICTTGL